MSTTGTRLTLTRVRCYWRPLIMAGAGLVLLGLFWFASRYPQLMSKAGHVGQALPSMAFSSEVVSVAEAAPVWRASTDIRTAVVRGATAPDIPSAITSIEGNTLVQ